MRLKIVIPVILLVCLILAALFWLRPKQHPIIPEPNQETRQESIQPTNQPTRNTTLVQPVAAPINHSAPVTNSAQIAEFTKTFVESRNLPITFFGRFIDQDSNPVPDVKVKFGIQQLTAYNPGQMKIGATNIQLERTSDEDGRIEIDSEIGDVIGVGTITKDGYVLSPKNPRGFGSSAGTYEDPIIFKMWKKTPSEQLVSQGGQTRIPYDGTPVVFDLLTGQKIAGDSTTGDLRVTLTRNPLAIPSNYHNAFEWHAAIEAIDGGVIQSDDEFMYEAPADGYQPKIQIDMPADATNWKNIYDISFYAKTRGGNVYSRVKFEFRVDSPKPQTGFIFSSTANPNGSRNLQP